MKVVPRDGVTAESIMRSVELRAVDVEEWGGVVFVSSTPYRLQMQMAELRRSEDDPDSMGLRVLNAVAPEMLFHCVRHEDGSRVFASLEEADDVLWSVPTDSVLRVINAILDFDGATEDGSDELEGN